MNETRLVLTQAELKAVKTALKSFVVRTCNNSKEATPEELEAMPQAAQVLLHYFKGW